jgi:hypothetical protein
MDDLNSAPAVACGGGEKPRGRPFEPGNPGRPRGARNKRTLLVEAWLGDKAEALTDKLMEIALKGDSAALRFCVARLLSARRDHPVVFELPDISTAADSLKAARAMLGACAEGALSPREATDVVELISKIRALEVGDFEARLTELERQLKG